MRLVFFGSDEIALPLLDWLVGKGRAHAEIVAVYTQPDRRVGRGQKIVPNEIKRWAETHHLPVHQPEKLTKAVRGELEALEADVALVMAYGHILRQSFIDTSRLGTLNLHASLLPKYRGASPIQTAVAAGERETGVSLMRIVRELDAGPVAAVERVGIAPTDTALEVEGKLAAACVPLLARTLPLLAADELEFVEQDHNTATFCRRLTKSDGVLDFGRSADELAARINGLFPWPACTVSINDQVIKLGGAAAEAGAGTPGIVAGADDDGLLVGTGDGRLRVRYMQRPGGRMLPASEFLRGFPVAPGTSIHSTSMPLLVSPVPFHR